jgi:hypothetical protein
MVLHSKLPRFADERDIFSGAIGVNLAQQSFKTLVDGGLREGLRSGRLRVARSFLRFLRG